MKSYEDMTTEQERLHEYDLVVAFCYNNPILHGQREITTHDIARILCKYPEEVREESVGWIVELTDSRHLLLVGWCDYTGWD